MAGLFDADSQLQALLEQQRLKNQQQQQQFGQLYGGAASNRRQAASNTIGAQIGASLGQGLAGGLFGESDAIKQAREVAEQENLAKQSFAKTDWKDPNSIRQASKLLMKVNPEAGLRLEERASEIDKAQREEQASLVSERLEQELLQATSQVALNPDDPKAFALALRKGGDPKALLELRKFGKESKSRYGKIAEDLGYSKGTPEYQAKVNELITVDPEAARIVNNMGGVPEPFTKKFGEEEGKRFSEQAAGAETAVKSLRALEQSIDLMNNNEIISGIGGNFKLGLAKVLAETGMIGSEDVAATEAFFANQGNQVAQVITQFGAGTGLSDADREYAKQIAGGEISLTRESLTKLLNLQRKYLQMGVEDYNTKLEGIDDEGIKAYAKPFDIPNVPIAIPPGARKGTTEDGTVVYQIDGKVVDKFGNEVK